MDETLPANIPPGTGLDSFTDETQTDKDGNNKIVNVIDIPNQRNRLNVSKALKLRLSNPKLSYADIGKACGGADKAHVFRALRPFLNLIKDPAAIKGFQQNKADLLNAAEMEMLSEIVNPEKIEKASLNNLAYAMRQMSDMSRLERDQATVIYDYLGEGRSLKEIQGEIMQLEKDAGYMIEDSQENE